MLHIVRNSPFESRVLDECLALMGEVIDMAGFVRLVVEHGSPLRW